MLLRARVLVGMAAAVGLSWMGGCGTYDMRTAGESSVVTAEMGQLRAEAGSDRLRAAVVNEGDQSVDVGAARVEWPGFAWSQVTVGQQVPVGQAAAFVVKVGEATCDAGPESPVAAPPRMRVQVDGAWQVVPITLDDSDVLRRLHDEACFQERLSESVTVEVRLPPRFGRYDGAPVQNAWLVLRRPDGVDAPPGEPVPVSVEALFGSVLLRVDPIRPRDPLAGPSTRTLQVPVRISVAGRCDPHTRSQSQQTFLLSAAVSLDGEAPRRVQLPLTAADRARLNRLMDLRCR